MNSDGFADPTVHWDTVYRANTPDALSWTRDNSPSVVSNWLEQLYLAPGRAVLEVGGGHGLWVDGLLERGCGPITVLDLSQTALEQAQKRLGKKGKAVRWQVGDITTAALEPNGYALWHDRATFHFFTDLPARERYLQQVRTSVQRGGHLMLSTFAPDGPEKCSGLPVQRYSTDALLELFTPHFQLRAEERELHHTPWGAVQPFTCIWLERVLSGDG
jgi:SAM-dependent methyltransferase